MSTFKREKPHIRIDRIGREMTPIERAAAAIDENYNPDQAPILAAMFQDYAQAVFESIDTDQLADALWESVDDKGIQGRLYRDDCTYLALAVKNWLTGEDTQQ